MLGNEDISGSDIVLAKARPKAQKILRNDRNDDNEIAEVNEIAEG